MDYWVITERGQALFKGGRQNWLLASSIASSCPDFILDYEDEWVADEEISCYNCKFRHWTESSFLCMKR